MTLAEIVALALNDASMRGGASIDRSLARTYVNRAIQYLYGALRAGGLQMTRTVDVALNGSDWHISLAAYPDFLNAQALWGRNGTPYLAFTLVNADKLEREALDYSYYAVAYDYDVDTERNQPRLVWSRVGAISPPPAQQLRFSYHRRPPELAASDDEPEPPLHLHGDMIAAVAAEFMRERLNDRTAATNALVTRIKESLVTDIVAPTRRSFGAQPWET